MPEGLPTPSPEELEAMFAAPAQENPADPNPVEAVASDPFDQIMAGADFADTDFQEALAEMAARPEYTGGALDDEHLTGAHATHEGRERIDASAVTDTDLDDLEDWFNAEVDDETRALLEAADRAGKMATAQAFNMLRNSTPEAFMAWSAQQEAIAQEQAKAEEDDDDEDTVETRRERLLKAQVAHMDELAKSRRKAVPKQTKTLINA